MISPHRLVWSWIGSNIEKFANPLRSEPGGDPPRAVTVCDISNVTFGETPRFRLLHRGYPNLPGWDDLYNWVNTGWDEHLETLRGVVELAHTR